jgi:CubicO group peptidase (beta-lactamase class C family)
LQEAGELDVRDSIELHLPDVPETWHDVRIHHLLCHQSGIWNMTNDPAYPIWCIEPSRPRKTMERFRDKPLEFEPGSSFSYSNSGYVMLAVLIEEISGEKWEDFMRKEVFDPLGMDDSGHDSFTEILVDRATGYMKKPLSKEIINAPYHDMDIPIGGGDLYSTVGDMLLWDQALYGDALLSQASRDAMFAPNLSGYGYGWMIGEKNGRAAISHGGGIHGFTTVIVRYTDDKVTVVVLCNNMWSGPERVADELARIVFAHDE